MSRRIIRWTPLAFILRHRRSEKSQLPLCSHRPEDGRDGVFDLGIDAVGSISMLSDRFSECGKDEFRLFGMEARLVLNLWPQVKVCLIAAERALFWRSRLRAIESLVSKDRTVKMSVKQSKSVSKLQTAKSLL